ncbi:cytochrome c oxidase subunit II [Natronobacterium gregoryi]|uniref:Cytochrome C oxidase subunit II n=2 Tax=Natronobacterium gregoryi TaxID=44930 RepID=L0AIL0_NATGS|nr:cytochrome c oxidase subunit II [Natronobacterium gregoryi]AFZ73017.1 heme/copper-type cytochrome/quinol oxidases, subunit 2 [Natronobacterium gregoryi SP2]ELY64872.1 cytochrome c oxidase subunit II [Natronobacterium gregoryi SP2]PLK18377.1 cytochrome C oxidase subunit II [Natronobacterium gregoryi SP2]SFJ71607.1 cytochrome c oxidase subunit 2 [Natronobacterium gregoryi]
MNIHTYEKFWLIGAMVLIVAFIATVTYGAAGLGIAMVDDEGGTIAPDEIGDHDKFGDPGVHQVGENEYDVYVHAYTFGYSPDTIEIPENSEVTFYVTSSDVTHSFTVVGTNVNTMVIPGEIAEITAQFDEPEEYGILCNEYCGFGHHDMEAELHVVPETEFDLTELAVDAPDEVDTDDQAQVTASVTNGMLEDLDTTVTLEIGNETVEEDVTVAGDSSEDVTFAVDASTLGDGDHDWTVTVDDYTESDQLTVGTDDDGDSDDGDTTEEE